MPHRDGMIIERPAGPRSYYVKTLERVEIVRKLLSEGTNFYVTKYRDINDDIDINTSLPMNSPSFHSRHELNNNENWSI